MGKNQRIKSPVAQSVKGRIREPSPELLSSHDDSHPIFCLRYLQSGFDLEECTKDQQAAFAKALRKRSQMSWYEIKNAPKHGLGLEKISRNSIKAPIPKHITEDVEYFIALRFFTKAPMVGYRIRNVFHIVWLDPKFTLYKHE